MWSKLENGSSGKAGAPLYKDFITLNDENYTFEIYLEEDSYKINVYNFSTQFTKYLTQTEIDTHIGSTQNYALLLLKISIENDDIILN